MPMFSSSKRTRFETIALPHLDALHSLAMHLTRNSADAEDLVQNTMVKAFRFFHRFEEGTQIKAWLFRMMVNLFYNDIRQGKSRQRLHEELEAARQYQVLSLDGSPLTMDWEAIAHSGLTRSFLRRELQSLPEEFGLAVILCDYYEFSYKEIADILGCPVGTIMSRLYRGRQILQKRLAQFAREQGFFKESLVNN